MDIRITRFLDQALGIPLSLSLGFLAKIGRTIKAALKENSSYPVKEIVIMKFWGLGNVILITPTLEAIRERYPQAKITFVTLEQNKSILECFNYCDAIEILSVKSFLTFLKGYCRLLYSLRKKKIDILIDAETFARSSALLSLFSSARKTIGFDTPRQFKGLLFNLPLKYKEDQHIVPTFYDLAVAAGCPQKKESDLFLSYPHIADDAKRKVEKFIRKEGGGQKKKIIIHMGTGPNAPTRRWPREHYISLVRLLLEENKNKDSGIGKGVLIFFTGAGEEEKEIHEVQKHFSHSVCNASQLKNIQELIALMKKADIFISSDTGPLHLASAVGIPTISMYGPNTPKIYGPWKGRKKSRNTILYQNMSSSPCMKNTNAKISKCIYRRPYCMLTIQPKDLLDKIRMICKT